MASWSQLAPEGVGALHEGWGHFSSPVLKGSQCTRSPGLLTSIFVQEFSGNEAVGAMHRLFANPMDYSLPGSSVHGILQARTLQWVTISFSNA